MIKKIIASALAASMLFTNIVFAEEKNEEYDFFTTLMTYAAQLYIDEEVTSEEIIDNAVKGAIKDNPELMRELLKAGFASLDDYSEYYTPEEFETFLNNMNHTFYGIGVYIRKMGDYIEVTNCIDGGSAIEAGIQAKDKIVRVDGVDAVRKTVDEVQNMITGELGTEVEVTVLRDDREIVYKLERREVSADTVSYALLKGDIAYVSIINFAEKTDAEMKKVLAELDEKGITKIILDLRNNPGGYLVSAINIAKMIVPEGVIVKTMYRYEDQNEVFYSSQKDVKYKFAVLVNENTASASEVLASAMQESGVGTLIGKTTYGKAVIQEMFRLSEGAFKITTGHYLTRNGNEINLVGIEPDIHVVNTTQRVDMSKYTPFDYKIKWKVGDNHDSVKAAKERLWGLGFYSGEINTEFDTGLEKAVTEFQAAMELYPYGVLDISTQVRIENEFYHTEELVDRQFDTAYEFFGGNPEDIEEEV